MDAARALTMQQLMAVMDLAMKRKDWDLATMVEDIKMLREFADGTRALPERTTESRGECGGGSDHDDG